MNMKFQYNDGGSIHARGAGNCVARAIAIAASMDYAEVCVLIENEAIYERRSRSRTRSGNYKPRSSARNGVYTTRKWFKELMARLGFRWVPTMQIGSGCTVHLRDGELPEGRIIATVSKHWTAVINGVINDTHDPSRDGTRCVYGYWIFEGRK